MDKEIVRDAVKMLNESILKQKEAKLLLAANGIEVIDVSVLFNHVQILSGIERLSKVLGYELAERGSRKDPTFLHDGVEYFEVGKGDNNDLPVE